MELRDLIVTPFVILLVYGIAYTIRSRVTDDINRVYFIPALTVKIIGALAVGFIYQFYYDGGDTFNYHTYGSRVIWDAFVDSPAKGIKLIINNGTDYANVYPYASRIIFFTDPSSYMVVKIAAILDLFTFSSYTATAVLFAIFSFIGMWMFFLTFYEQYPQLHRWLAIASFFIPSVFFWGSGLLKDTITLGALGIATYQLQKMFIVGRRSFFNWLLLGLSLYLLYSIKVYILLTFLPAAILWIFLAKLESIRSTILKFMAFPFVFTAALALGYFAMVKAGEDNEKYALASLGKTAQVTAYDIRYWTGRDAGSGYTLGELDGTFGSMLRLAPQAVNVTLFRPYLWEVNNPLMLMSALESFVLLCLCLFTLAKKNIWIFRTIGNPDIFFAVVFSLTFAFAVGVSTFNFGTLVRYKIPLLPFLLVAIVVTLHQSKSETKLTELETTE
ncbi:MAG: hypothetical protein OEV74_00975 [Cyclobacteriaceae bacterium]|nr:hypothetical protein [Cyclobacteriaceae bacterium]MDH4294821.1 hypothetical protein [Cyclobacteriaceae bacterium]MDH5248125.1 hypothetical protein [Cyclobacteriaceae bacterium]